MERNKKKTHNKTNRVGSFQLQQLISHFFNTKNEACAVRTFQEIAHMQYT